MEFVGLEGQQVIVAKDVVSAFRAELTGSLLTPDDADYTADRTVWNAMIDKRPALAVRCASVDDVSATVRFADRHGVLLAVRGAGHNIAGTAVCDGGVLVDPSHWETVDVDAEKQTATIQPGATLADVDRATQAMASRYQLELTQPNSLMTRHRMPMAACT